MAAAAAIPAIIGAIGSIGGGAAAGKGGGKGASPAEKEAARASREVRTQTRPLRLNVLDLFNQVVSGAKTGTLGTQVPFIQQAVSQSLASESRARDTTERTIARAGLGRTPFGQRILAEQRRSGAESRSLLPQQLAAPFLSGAPEFAGSLTSAGLSSTTGLGFAGAQRQAAEQRNQTQLILSLADIARQAGAASAAAGE